MGMFKDIKKMKEQGRTSSGPRQAHRHDRDDARHAGSISRASSAVDDAWRCRPTAEVPGAAQTCTQGRATSPASSRRTLINFNPQVILDLQSPSRPGRLRGELTEAVPSVLAGSAGAEIGVSRRPERPVDHASTGPRLSHDRIACDRGGPAGRPGRAASTTDHPGYLSVLSESPGGSGWVQVERLRAGAAADADGVTPNPIVDAETKRVVCLRCDHGAHRA